jgi:hypothetical protein
MVYCGDVMGDLSLAERVINLEAVVKRLDELIAELKEDKTEVPKRRGNPNWVKKVVSED